MAGKPNKDVEQRNKAIRLDYYQLFDKDGLRKVKVIRRLAAKYELASRTIEDIIYGS